MTPSRGINEAPFLIRVKDPSKLDFEKISGNLVCIDKIIYKCNYISRNMQSLI